MNEVNGGPEIITLAGVRERMAAYEEECKRKEKGLPKTKITVFRVEDGGKMQGSFSRGSEHENGAEHPEHHGSHDDDKSVGADDLNLEPDEQDPDDSAAFDYSARPGFFRGCSFGDSDNENEKEPVEKTPEQLAMDAKEEEAKKSFTILLEKEKGHALSSSQAPVVLQSFSSLQKRYLSAVAELRPEGDFDSSATPATINKQKIKAELRKEANRKERFSTLKSSYYAYAKAAQDKRDEVEDICVEEEIEKLEDEVVEEWVDYAEKAVEKVEILVAAKDSGDDDEGAEEGAGEEDLAEMEKWREEAKKLKEEANERKQRKAEQEAFRAERKEKAKERAKQRAKYLKKKKEVAEAKKKAEQEAAASKAQEDESEKETQETGEEADAEATAQDKATEPEAEHEAEVPAETAEGAKKKADHDAKKKADHDKKRSDHGKKKKKEEKSKDEKKKKDKKKKGDEGDDEVDKKKEDDLQSDGEDAHDEKFPRNLDGSIWKNVLKFWTNKPKSLKEKSSKVIITTIPGSDCFRPTETSGSDNASFYWHKVDGDFDCVVHIKGEFANAYDKAGIMLRVDEKTWMMSGVEYFGEQLNNASCITRGISDWSLAPLPADAKKGCWFCVKRVGNKVESFYSMDTKNWIQTRQGLFTDAPTIKVGIATGSPTGAGFKVTFDRFWMKKK